VSQTQSCPQGSPSASLWGHPTALSQSQALRLSPPSGPRWPHLWVPTCPWSPSADSKLNLCGVVSSILEFFN
jgi:hypothetical protein